MKSKILEVYFQGLESDETIEIHRFVNFKSWNKMKLYNVIGCIAGDSKTGSLDNQEGKKTAASRRQSEPASKSRSIGQGQIGQVKN